MKSARACVVAVLRAPMIGTLAGTAAAETGGRRHHGVLLPRARRRQRLGS